jgi:hypothetical protein
MSYSIKEFRLRKPNMNMEKKDFLGNQKSEKSHSYHFKKKNDIYPNPKSCQR